MEYAKKGEGVLRAGYFEHIWEWEWEESHEAADELTEVKHEEMEGLEYDRISCEVDRHDQ